MHDQSRVHAIETQRKRIQEIKDRQAEEREYVKRIKEEIKDVENKEIKKKEEFHTKMEQLQSHAKEIRALRVVEKKKEAERDIEYTRQYAAQLDKADRERTAALSKIKQFMGNKANAFE